MDSVPPQSKAADRRDEPARLSPYATPSATREVLERHGLYTKYALGQNFLVSDEVVKKILDLADVRFTDHVLEVGPGIGTLTSALLQRSGHVTSIEMDHDLPEVLRETLALWLDRFTLLEMDALDATREHFWQSAAEAPETPETPEVPEVPEAPETPETPEVPEVPEAPEAAEAAEAAEVPPLPNKLVSNLPYGVAATVVLDYLQRFDFLQDATVMVQKEVADRMMAKPGTKAYGAYTVKLGLFAKVSGRFPVASGNFFPPPRVESAVVRLDRAIACDDKGRPLSHDELKCTCRIVDAAFANRRKTLANSCKAYFANDPEVLERLPRLFEGAGVDFRRRGETLTQEEFIRLAKHL